MYTIVFSGEFDGKISFHDEHGVASPQLILDMLNDGELKLNKVVTSHPVKNDNGTWDQLCSYSYYLEERKVR
jgi:hypothetical protein